MFSKQAKTNTLETVPAKFDSAAGAAPSEASRKTPKAASLISENLTIEGSVVGDGELHIDGVVRGDVRIGKLTIGETGHVEGSIAAESVEVRGRIVGTLTAKQIRLYGAAHVDGDITHEQLSIELGAFFQGRSLKFQRPAPAIVSVVENEAEARTA
jgi:cytoskeletal protein CcmA (bactofilin family)